MKNLTYIVSGLLLASSVAWSDSNAINMMPQISQNDSAQLVLAKSSRGIREIYQSLGLGRIQLQTQNLVNEIRSEKVVRSESHSTRAGLKAKLSSLLLGFSASGEETSSSRIDYTQVVAKNPSQVLRQQVKASRDLAKLRSDLLQLMNTHEKELIALKELGLLQAAAAYQMLQNGEDVPWDDVNANMQMVTDMNFQGLQTVTRCLTLQHAATSSSDSSDASAGLHLRLLFFSVNLSGEESEKNYYRQMAYTEKQCSSSTNTVTLTTKDTVYSVDLSLLDMKVARWVKALALAQATQDHGILFPTWGSPYFQ